MRLVRITAALAAMLERDCAAFQTEVASLGEQEARVREVIAQTLAMADAAPDEAPWGGYLAVAEGRVVGTCAFVGAPSAGAVEIAYFTFPPFERRGLATRMAAELIDRALGTPAVLRVVAHTLPEPNASTRVLEKLGFTRAGEIVDAEIGRAWRWERAAG